MLRKLALYGAFILTLAACGRAEETTSPAAPTTQVVRPSATIAATAVTPTLVPTVEAAVETRTATLTPAVDHSMPAAIPEDVTSLAAADHHELAGPHIQVIEQEPASPAELDRAAEISAQARQALAKYEDYQAALADGYWILGPDVPQDIYHFINLQEAYRNRNVVDPARPTALLYEKEGDGWRWAGVMYSAPMEASLAEIEAHFPVNVGQWHAHVNLCMPPGEQDWQTALTDPRFGFSGSIDTPEECAAAGGRFMDDLFGWMVHVTW